MTGRRQTIGRRDTDGRIAPLAAVERARRIRDAVRSRYAGAATDRDRLAAAFDYARAGVAAAERAGLDEVSSVAAEAIRVLMATGDAACDALARRGRP